MGGSRVQDAVYRRRGACGLCGLGFAITKPLCGNGGTCRSRAWRRARPMEKDYLSLKRASASRTSGQWKEDDFEVLADGVVVGRIFNAAASPVGSPWMWTLIFPHHKGRSPTHGYEATREAAMAAFAKSWRRE